jgi:hypothetical protein
VKKVIDFKFKDGESFHNGIAVVSADSLYGAINKSGEFVIAPQYEELSEIGDDVYMGVKNDLSGYLTKKGKPLTQFIFDVAGDFRNGYAVVSKDEKFGLINISGAYNIEPKYENLSFIGDGLLKAQNEDDAWGIVNVQGQIILPFLYDAIGDFSEHRALVVKGEKCGYINESGEIIIPVNFRYTSIMLTQAKFMDGYALMKQKLKSILIDTTGKPVTFPGVLDYGRPSSGLIPVKKNKRWGYADLSGKIVIQPLFESAEPFSNGYATIHMNKMAGLIDSTGTIFIQPLYEDVIAMEKVFLIKSNGKFGLLSLSGILLVPCQYDKIEFLSPSVAKPINSTGYCYVNLNTGKIIWTRN